MVKSYRLYEPDPLEKEFRYALYQKRTGTVFIADTVSGYDRIRLVRMAKRPVGGRMKNILCLDLGTQMGWASFSNGSILSGTESFQPGRHEGGGMRYLRFSYRLDEFRRLLNPLHAVYYEEVRARQPSVAADQTYGGFLASLTAWCEANNIPYKGIPVGTIKKHATGKGNANKDDVRMAVEIQGFYPRDDNEADAIGLLLYVKQTTERN